MGSELRKEQGMEGPADASALLPCDAKTFGFLDMKLAQNSDYIWY
jgi:hypothetical protein